MCIMSVEISCQGSWFRSNERPKIGARAAEYFRQFKRYIQIERFQDDFLVTNVVDEYLQACGLVVLIVRAADEHNKGHAETEILFMNSIFKKLIILSAANGATANLLN